MNKEEQILLINKMKDIPIMEISNFIPNTGSIPQLLYDVGIKTLYELYYINSMGFIILTNLSFIVTLY
jgi:hypothetical protein